MKRVHLKHNKAFESSTIDWWFVSKSYKLFTVMSVFKGYFNSCSFFHKISFAIKTMIDIYKMCAKFSGTDFLNEILKTLLKTRFLAETFAYI